MTWMRLDMLPAEENGQYSALQEAFFEVFAAVGAPKDAAMYVTMGPTQSGAFYFSSAAAKLFATVLKARGARPCAVPSRKDVSLLVGHGNEPLDMLAE